MGQDSLMQKTLRQLHERTKLWEGECEVIHDNLRTFLIKLMKSEVLRFTTRTENEWRTLADDIRKRGDLPNLLEQLSAATFQRTHWHELLRSTWASRIVT
jgi:hypothetical protein